MAKSLEEEPIHSGIVLFRISSFMEMGFDPIEAEILALGEIDLDKMRSMIGEGCTPELAARILS